MDRTHVSFLIVVGALCLRCGGSTVSSGSAGGAGGGAGSGGGGSGGQTLDASNSDAPTTCTAMVRFHMTATNGKSSDFCVGSECTNTWVNVTTSAGMPITFDQGCSASCADCRFVACPPVACALPQLMKADGETLEWDGSTWEPGTCGAQMSCRSHQCAAAGHYIAKMCASHSVPDAGAFGSCNPTPMLTCVEVPFDYPTMGVVEGMVD